MKYSLEKHNEKFTIELANSVELTIKVRYMKRHTCYDVHSDGGYHGSIYRHVNGWRSDEQMDKMIIDVIGELIDRRAKN